MNDIPSSVLNIKNVLFPEGTQLCYSYVNILQSLRSKRLISIDDYLKCKEFIKKMC